jgi:membrane protein implicated in regulation of membrane protease activity
MDGSTAAAVAAPTGFIGWVMANGQMLVFFAQLAYWFFMVFFLGYAVFQYKRWVNFQMGIGKSGQLRKDAEKADSGTKVSVDEFVE